MKTSIQVLSQRGRLIGVWVPPTNPPSDLRAPTAVLRAGPGQKIQNVTVEIGDATFKTAKHVADFHSALRKQLKLKK
jgi:hypothetical protein